MRKTGSESQIVPRDLLDPGRRVGPPRPSLTNRRKRRPNAYYAMIAVVVAAGGTGITFSRNGGPARRTPAQPETAITNGAGR